MITVSQTERDERIAAARQKLKQFKKDTKLNSNGQQAQTHLPNTDELYMLNPANHQNYPQMPSQVSFSGRSTPSSLYEYSNAFPSNYHVQKPYQELHTNHQIGINNNSLSPPMVSLSPVVLDASNLSQFKEQLQLHVQTIGILVAEKAELQSKLQQQLKKSDKKQDECDELMGRLKASRQKIADLEKLVQQLSTNNQQMQQNGHEIGKNSEMENLRMEINSNHLFIDELKMRLNESNEKLQFKQQETQKLAQLTLDLKSQLEILQLKVIQQTASATGKEENEPAKERMQKNSEDDEVVRQLKEENSNLTNQLSEINAKFDENKQTIKVEYENYVQQLQRQIESLVDQINRMSDEREHYFEKIDSLELKLKNSIESNRKLQADYDDIKVNNQQQQQVVSSSASRDEKIDLLENEIKYFKHQIEMLVKEEKELNKLVQERDNSLSNLNKLIENYEKEREQYSNLLEQSHNDKQTISRILKQNNELKQQLTELQDAYVQVTQQNLDLATKLDSQQFKLKQFEISRAQVQQSSENNTQAEQTEEDDGGEWDGNEQAGINNEFENSTLMDSIRERIEYLEKENRDLNDYIKLMNEKLIEKREAEVFKEKPMVDSTEHSIDSALLEKFQEKIRKLELEKAELVEKLCQSSKEETGNSTSSQEQPQSSEQNSSFSEQYVNNMKLLEEKFNKIMKENAELMDKNQNLEHIIQQLQFETETIIDYITMYQMERVKLNEKYKQKDESIRSLSTQLQVNKLALHEVYNCLIAYINLVDSKPMQQQQDSSTEEAQAHSESVVKENVEGSSSNDTSKEDQENNHQKAQYLFNRIQLLLSELTQSSSTTLQAIGTLNQSTNKIANQTSQSLSSQFIQNNKQQQSLIDTKSVQNGRIHTMLCSNCYGDLFVV